MDYLKVRRDSILVTLFFILCCIYSFPIIDETIQFSFEQLVRLNQPRFFDLNLRPLFLHLPAILLCFLQELVVIITFRPHSLAILGLLHGLAGRRDVAIADYHICLFLEYFLGVEEVVADEGGVHEVPVALALFEGTVEVGVDAFFAGLLVDVDASEGGAFGEAVVAALIQTIGADCSLHRLYYRYYNTTCLQNISQLVESLIQIITPYAQDYLHGLLEVLNHEGGGVEGVVLWPVVHSRLGQEGGPADRVGASDVSSGVVSHHKEAAVSESLLHVGLYELESQFLWLAEVEFVELEVMPPAVLLQHVVEGAKGQSRPVVPSCPDDIILSGVVGGQREVPDLLFKEDVVDDFEGGFVGADIVEGEDGVDDLSPLVVVAGQGGQLEPGLQSLDELVVFGFSLVEGDGWIMVSRLALVEEGVEFISGNIVGDAHLVDNISDPQGSAEQQYAFLLAVLEQVRPNWTVIHEHIFRAEEILPEDIIHLLHFQ